MANLYADEQFPLAIVELLRALEHNVLTVQEAGKAGLKIPDDEVLAFASNNGRAILTLNRRDFKRLHQQQPSHAGIVVCTDDPDRQQLAVRIHTALLTEEPLDGKLLSIIRPAR